MFATSDAVLATAALSALFAYPARRALSSARVAAQGGVIGRVLHLATGRVRPAQVDRERGDREHRHHRQGDEDDGKASVVVASAQASQQSAHGFRSESHWGRPRMVITALPVTVWALPATNWPT